MDTLNSIDLAEELRTEAAYHEAGHAVVGLAFGLPLVHVTIRAGDLYTGFTEFDLPCLFGKEVKPDGLALLAGDSGTRATVEAIVRAQLAGRITSKQFSGERYDFDPNCASNDEKIARSFLSFLAADEIELDAYYRLLEIQTERLIAMPLYRAQVERLAAALLEHDTLTSEEAVQAMLYGHKALDA